MKKFVHISKQVLEDLPLFAARQLEDSRIRAFVNASNEIGNEWMVEVKVKHIREDDSFVIEFED